jgi:hypothetical protein
MHQELSRSPGAVDRVVSSSLDGVFILKYFSQSSVRGDMQTLTDREIMWKEVEKSMFD